MAPEKSSKVYDAAIENDRRYFGFVMKRLARAMHHCKSKETDLYSKGLLDRLRCLNTTRSARPLSIKYGTLRETSSTTPAHGVELRGTIQEENQSTHIDWMSNGTSERGYSHDLSYTNSLTDQELCPW